MKEEYKRRFKVLLAFALGALVVISIYSIASNDSISKADLESEKLNVMRELEELSLSYNALLERSNWDNKELRGAKANIDILIDSLNNTSVTLKSFFILKEKQAEFQSTINALIRENGELINDNGILLHSLNFRKKELSKTRQELQNYQDKNSRLLLEKDELADKINNSAFLNLVNLDVAAIKERSSGKQILTNKASKVDKFRVCYSIAKNPFVKEGFKELFVQIIGPRQLVISPKYKRFKEDRFELDYSLITKFNYVNENINQCDYLEVDSKDKLIKGVYTINIFDGKNIVTSYKLELK